MDSMVKQRGFSLIELMIVVAIFSVLAVVGFGLTRDTLPRYRAYSAAEQFAGNVASAGWSPFVALRVPNLDERLRRRPHRLERRQHG